MKKAALFSRHRLQSLALIVKVASGVLSDWFRARKPLVVVSFMSNGLTRHWRGYSRARGLALIEDLERGLAAVRHLVGYADFRRVGSMKEAKTHGVYRLEGKTYVVKDGDIMHIL